jgi:hypothetical protein
MDMLYSAKIRDMAEAIAAQTILAALAMLCISFIRAYMVALVCFNTILLTPFFTCTYARKRVSNRSNHERKFALFTGCTGQKYLQDINDRSATCYKIKMDI